jgi:putative spermidine/putrescine transport system permease protein
MSSFSAGDAGADLAGLEQLERVTRTERALGAAKAPPERGRGWVTAALAAPGFLWLAFYLIVPLVFIVLVSFWTYSQGAQSGFVEHWTTSNYTSIFASSTYWNNMLGSFEQSMIAVAACLIFGFPVAYFLALKVEKLRNQIALFIIALAPFWTSFLVRSVAWTYPLMGRDGAVNGILEWLGLVNPNNPIEALGFSRLSVTLAMIQLYMLFMITPLFFTLAQIDRTALEAARDLGGNWWDTFRAVILPQSLPGIVIGSIFIFVLTMGEYGTVLVVGGNAVQSVGTTINNYITNAVEYPQGSAAAVLLVVALIAGVFVITRFSNLREEL